MQLASEVVDVLVLLKTCLNIVSQDQTLGEYFIVIPSETKQNAEYSIWSALLSLFKRTAPEQRERIEELILMALNSANDHVMELLMLADFQTRLADELLGLFLQLPKMNNGGSSRSIIESEQVYRYKLHLRLCNTLTSEQAGLTNSPNTFSDSLSLSLEERFLEQALVPSLANSSSPSLVHDTLIAKESLQLCSGPLQDAFLALTVGLQARQLRDMLCERILSPDVHLSMATMRFFDVICGLYHQSATDSLMLSHIESAAAAAAAVGGATTSDDGEGRAGCTFEPILNSFPAAFTHDRASGSSLDSYTLHARDVIAEVAAMHASMGIQHPDNDKEWVVSHRSCGPFLSAVVAKLRDFVKLSLKECLLVTSIISRCLTYPSRPLYQILSHLTLETVAMVSAECELRASSFKMGRDDLKAAIENAYSSLTSLRDFDLDEKKIAGTEETMFFQKLVILDEFVRELVAIDSAKTVWEIENKETH